MDAKVTVEEFIKKWETVYFSEYAVADKIAPVSLTFTAPTFSSLAHSVALRIVPPGCSGAVDLTLGAVLVSRMRPSASSESAQKAWITIITGNWDAQPL
jgi:hypothetical protein